MSSQHDPTLRKLTANESKLRRGEVERQRRQWYIDTVVQFKIYQARLAALVTNLNRKSPDIDTDPQVVSPWSPTLQQEALAQMETQIYPVPDILITRTQRIQQQQLPITGDIVMEKVTQGQPSEQTTTYQDDKITRIRRELVTECQRKMRDYYHEQNPKRMPSTIRMALLKKMALEPLERGEFFPGTGIDGIIGVLVVADSSIGDQIICA